MRRLRSAIRLFADRLRYRHSAPALLLLCEARAGKTAARLPGESGEAYLRRLAAEVPGSEEADALCRLAELVEREFYRQKKDALQNVPPDLYRQIRAIRSFPQTRAGK